MRSVSRNEIEDFLYNEADLLEYMGADPATNVVGMYIEGPRDYSNARRLTAKEKFFVGGGTVVVNEDELNTAANPVTALVTPVST